MDLYFIKTEGTGTSGSGGGPNTTCVGQTDSWNMGSARAVWPHWSWEPGGV